MGTAAIHTHTPINDHTHIYTPTHVYTHTYTLEMKNNFYYAHQCLEFSQQDSRTRKNDWIFATLSISLHKMSE